MGTVLIRSKCTLLLLPPGRAVPEGGEKDKKERRRKRQQEEVRREKCSCTVLWPSCRESKADGYVKIYLFFPLRFRSLGKLLPVR